MVNFMYYINCFFVYSIFGYFFETFLSKIKNIDFSSGILFLPWTPIYGFGSIIILLISNFVFNYFYISKWKEVLIVFFIVIIILTLIELLGGFLIEKIFNIVFWDYKDYQYHIGKYIAVEVSFIWGFMSILFIYFIHPLFYNLIIIIPFFITYFLIILFFIDCFLTFYKYKYRV